MKLPKQIQVGKTVYEVRRDKFSDMFGTMGSCDYKEKVIVIATHSTIDGKRYKAEEIHDTFWHEIVHCILHDMNHPLESNERFVTKFANRLATAINSAKF